MTGLSRIGHFNPRKIVLFAEEDSLEVNTITNVHVVVKFIVEMDDAEIIANSHCKEDLLRLLHQYLIALSNYGPKKKKKKNTTQNETTHSEL